MLEKDTLLNINEVRALKVPINTGPIRELIVGRFQNTESRAIFHFSGLAKGDTILGVTLVFHGSSVFYDGPTGGTLNIDFKAMNPDPSGEWDQTVNIDVPTETGLLSKFGGPVLATMTVDTTVASRDSVSSPALTNLVQQWTDSTVVNNGLIMLFDPAATFAKAFHAGSITISDSTQPMIRIRYKNRAFQINDTTLTILVNQDAYHIVDKNIYEPNTIFTTSGIATRSWIKFDLVPLKIPSNATIHQANVTFHEKPNQSKYKIGGIQFLAQRITDENSPKPDSLGTDNTLYIVGTMQADTLVIDLARYFQDWSQNSTATYPNHGIVLRILDESTLTATPPSLLDRHAFYGKPNAPADSTKLPKIKLIYSVPQ
jgi:hypothetical protein